MAKFKVESIQEQAGGDVHCDTYVLLEDDSVIGHFTVVLKAADILALAGETLENRIAGYVDLFSADPRIATTVLSEAAVAQLNADVTFPVTVEL